MEAKGVCYARPHVNAYRVIHVAFGKNAKSSLRYSSPVDKNLQKVFG